MVNKASKFSRNKIMATSIAILLLLSMAGALAFAPTSALNPPVVTTHYSFTYVSVGGNVVGVGQQILLVLWTADIPPDIGETDGILQTPEHRASWTGQQFNVTDPDGITTNLPIGASLYKKLDMSVAKLIGHD